MKGNKSLLFLIRAVSIIIPLLVGMLIILPKKVELGSWVYQLPHFNALINTTTVLCLIGAVVSVKSGNIKIHRNLMLTGFSLGILFLLAYVTYHASVGSVKFGDLNGDNIVSEDELLMVGSWRKFYFMVLASHILLSMAVVPLVLLSVFYGLNDAREKHRKIVKWTFPIWLYVSITGVVVYLMIRPYYLN